MREIANDIKVSPTPIQRNALDVAMELTKMYVERTPVDAEELDSVFARFYAVANTLQNKSSSHLSVLIPAELLSKIK